MGLFPGPVPLRVKCTLGVHAAGVEGESLAGESMVGAWAYRWGNPGTCAAPHGIEGGQGNLPIILLSRLHKCWK